MNYPHDSKRVMGVLIPLAALRSDASIGCGEFADLPGLAEWCRSAGLKMIQLLPVNDTGGESSPYSALSAYALHPLFVRITDIPEFQHLPTMTRNSIDLALEKARTDYEGTARFDYAGVIVEKFNFLRIIFEESRESILSSAELKEFVRNNAWVRPYSVFRALKERNHQKAWTQWDEFRDSDIATVNKLWNRASLKHATRFYAWLQMRLADQFRVASETVSAMGVALKGDIPILMNQDSVDAWYNSEVFRPEQRAGAPPDMFSELGQNWGFPIYNWQHLEETDYEWWRERLRQAARFYHAYRIDHVLGFFRIWAIPARNFSGILGFFWPQDGITREELHRAGFDDSRLRWLSEPHMPGEELHRVFGEDLSILENSLLRKIEGEELYLFSDRINGESDICALSSLDSEQQNWLLAQYRDRVFVEMPDGALAPTWLFRECSRYRTIDQSERDRLETIVAEHELSSNELWANHGRRLLRFMRESTEMLTCAEDLGVVPEAVPRVLDELDVLSLRIPRWSHYWDKPGEPLIPFDEYPEASVCAPSVHDTSTMRGWWHTEEGREQLWSILGGPEPCPTSFDPATARAVYRAFAGCNSRIVVFQLQDFLALTPELTHADPAEERINIPGTSSAFNWTWRMPVTIEALQNHPVLAGEVRALAETR